MIIKKEHNSQKISLNIKGMEIQHLMQSKKYWKSNFFMEKLK